MCVYESAMGEWKGEVSSRCLVAWHDRECVEGFALFGGYLRVFMRLHALCEDFFITRDDAYQSLLSCGVAVFEKETIMC